VTRVVQVPPPDGVAPGGERRGGGLALGIQVASERGSVDVDRGRRHDEGARSGIDADRPGARESEPPGAETSFRMDDLIPDESRQEHGPILAIHQSVSWTAKVSTRPSSSPQSSRVFMLTQVPSYSRWKPRLAGCCGRRVPVRTE
jgi:hypothetical protein